MGQKGCDEVDKLDPKSSGDPEVISEHKGAAEGTDRSSQCLKVSRLVRLRCLGLELSRHAPDSHSFLSYYRISQSALLLQHPSWGVAITPEHRESGPGLPRIYKVPQCAPFPWRM